MPVYEQKPKKMGIRCPKCGSSNIDQYRMPTGPIWCSNCGFRVEHKESDKSFYYEVEDGQE